MTETKHSPIPWFVHDFTSASDDPCLSDVSISCDHPATITVAAMDRAMTATFEEARANADFIVLACNAYYSDQATIAAQAKRIAWLERPIGNDELEAALREVYQEDSEHDGIFDGMMKFALESAVAIRTKPENRK